MKKFNAEKIQKSMRNLNLVDLPVLTEPFRLEPLYINCHGADMLNQKSQLFSHVHAYFELHFVLEGEAYYLFEGEERTVGRNMFVIVSPEVEHSLMSTDASTVKVGLGVMFSSLENDGISDNLKKAFSAESYIIGQLSALMRAVLESILAESASPTLFSPYLIRDYIVKLLFEIYYALDQNPPLQYKVSDRFEDQRIIRVKQFINDNINKPINGSTVADYMHMSSKQLNRIFSVSEGMSVSKYISSIKVNRAIKLLRTSKLTIRDIAYSLGFDNEKSFGAFFKNATELSPSQFRKYHASLDA